MSERLLSSLPHQLAVSHWFTNASQPAETHRYFLLILKWIEPNTLYTCLCILTTLQFRRRNATCVRIQRLISWLPVFQVNLWSRISLLDMDRQVLQLPHVHWTQLRALWICVSLYTLCTLQVLPVSLDPVSDFLLPLWKCRFAVTYTELQMFGLEKLTTPSWVSEYRCRCYFLPPCSLWRYPGELFEEWLNDSVERRQGELHRQVVAS